MFCVGASALSLYYVSLGQGSAVDLCPLGFCWYLSFKVSIIEGSKLYILSRVCFVTPVRALCVLVVELSWPRGISVFYFILFFYFFFFFFFFSLCGVSFQYSLVVECVLDTRANYLER